MNINNKKLYKKRNGMICGVCAGAAEFLEIDVTLARLIWGVCLFTGLGLAAYIIAAVVMPFEDQVV